MHQSLLHIVAPAARDTVDTLVALDALIEKVAHELSYM